MSPGKLVDEKDVGCQDKSGPGKIHEVILVVYALLLKQTRVNPNADTDVIEHRDVKQGGFVVISISQNQEHIVVKPSSERKKQPLLIIDYF